MKAPTMDTDGYPTEETLEYISKWPITKHPFQSAIDLLAWIKPAWNWQDWGFKQEIAESDIPSQGKVMKVELHTGGWSGNESIIAALKESMDGFFFTFFHTKWHRGGHFYFEIPIEAASVPQTSDPESTQAASTQEPDGQ